MKRNSILKHIVAWSVVAIVIAVCLIIGPTEAKADTININHPGSVEHIGGTFVQLNINGSHWGNKNGGGIEFDVTTYDSDLTSAPSKAATTLRSPISPNGGSGDLREGWWEISLNIPEGLDGPPGNFYFQYLCDSMFHYGTNNTSVLDLYCSN